MAWKVKTPPTGEPVTIEELKEHLKVSHTDEDTLITSLGKAAREYIEKLTDKVLLTTVVQEYFNEFPLDNICLTVQPVISIDSVSYIAAETEDLTTTTLEATKYRKDTVSDPARIAPRSGESWPNTRKELNAVIVEYKAGFGVASDVPDRFKTAIKLLTAELYENRENRVRNLPTTVLALLKFDIDFSIY